MEYLKNKDIEIEFKQKTRRAKDLIEEVTGEKIEKEPRIFIFSEEDLKKSDIDVVGMHRNNIIALRKELVNNISEKENADFVLYHEFFHWAVHQVKNGFDDTPEEKPLAFPLRTLFVVAIPQERLKVSFIKEGTAELFAATLISKTKEEIPRNIFSIHFYPEVSNNIEMIHNLRAQIKLGLVINEVYYTFRQLEGFTMKELMRVIDENSITEKDGRKMFPLSVVINSFRDFALIKEMMDKSAEKFYLEHNWMAIPLIGKITTLLSLEVYKKYGKDEKQLLKDLIYPSWDVIEKVVEEIKKDEGEQLLKTALSDLTLNFKWAGFLRDDEIQFLKDIIKDPVAAQQFLKDQDKANELKEILKKMYRKN